MKIQLRRFGVSVAVVVGLVVSCFASAAEADDSVQGAPLSAGTEPSSRALPGCIPKAKCCIICSHMGKACGNSCIEKEKTCQKKDKGCACEVDDVCPTP
jgi:hypothetical protein